MFSELDHHWMQQALAMAKYAASSGEVPIGAVLVKDETLIAAAGNSPIRLNDPSAHAEVLVLREAGVILQNYRLLNTTLYVTLEPCLMCYGALIHARVKRLVYGTPDKRVGVLSTGAISNLAHTLNHNLVHEHGLLEEACQHQLQQFFKSRR